MNKLDEMQTRAKIRQQVNRIPDEDLYSQFNKLRIRQRYLYNRGTDDQLGEYEENRIRIEEIAKRYRQCMKKRMTCR